MDWTLYLGIALGVASLASLFFIWPSRKEDVAFSLGFDHGLADIDSDWRPRSAKEHIAYCRGYEQGQDARASLIIRKKGN